LALLLTFIHFHQKFSEQFHFHLKFRFTSNKVENLLLKVSVRISEKLEAALRHILNLRQIYSNIPQTLNY